MPPITSTHFLLGETAVAAGQSRYGYLFPDLADEELSGCFQGTTPAETCARLREFEIASRVPLSHQPALPMRLPAAYTYFGQFVNHDISAPVGDVTQQTDRPAPLGVIGAVDPPGLDRTERSSREVILANLANEHPEPMTLCSLYGDGPDSTDPGIAGLYEPDRKRFILGVTRRAPDSVFTRAMIDPRWVVHAAGARDIPRKDRRPLIADCRNDENVIISQLHLALMLFHNKAVAVLEPGHPDPADCFRAARRLVTLHYHWLILNDFLPKLLSPAVLGKPLANRPGRLSGRGEVPLEFTTAAFRFGHSMVGSAYDFNANFGVHGRIAKRGASLADLFDFTSAQNMDGAGADAQVLPDHWVIDWKRMTRARRPGGRGLGGAERIDMIFARDMLSQIGSSQVTVHGSILFRNLMRGYHRRIPFGQRLAAACGVPPLTSSEIRDVLPEGLRAPAERMGFLTETPAWLYFLLEARVREGGERVGPAASHIIADTIVGLMQLNPGSLLHEEGGTWHPRQSPLAVPGTEGLTDLRRFLCFAVKDTAVPQEK